MILYPAIDLKDGVCVRLLRGQMEQATIFNTVPAEQAIFFQTQGFRWLHIVDLNGAVCGRPVNAEAVEEILKTVDIPIQLGGGIRNLETIEYWLSRGVKRVILGTIAIHTPEIVFEACRQFEGQIAVGIDAREGYVAFSGWREEVPIKSLDLALRYEDRGVAAIIYTDINRDGAMGGLNIEVTADLASHLMTPVIASGGVSSINDLIELKKYAFTGIEGVIVGRALYDGFIDPATALEVLGS